MVSTLEQAQAIQDRRVKTGKKGYAKAVRRFFLRISKVSGVEYKRALSLVRVSFPEVAADE